MPKTIEQRLENVESELAELKALIPGPNRISAICGSFKDDSEFEKVLRLGKELRDEEPPLKSD